MSSEVVNRKKSIRTRIEPSEPGMRTRAVRIGDVWLGELQDSRKEGFNFRWRTDTISLKNINQTVDELSQFVLKRPLQEAVNGSFSLAVNIQKDGRSLTPGGKVFDRQNVAEMNQALAEVTLAGETPEIKAEYTLRDFNKNLGFFFKLETPPFIDAISQLTLVIGPLRKEVYTPEFVMWLIANNVNRGRFGSINEIDIEGLCEQFEIFMGERT